MNRAPCSEHTGEHLAHVLDSMLSVHLLTTKLGITPLLTGGSTCFSATSPLKGSVYSNWSADSIFRLRYCVVWPCGTDIARHHDIYTHLCPVSYGFAGM
jgi:hypothetical protein